MIEGVATAHHDISLAHRYEAVRTHVLRETTSVGRGGLIVLLRQGVAAWMASSSAASTANRPVTVPARSIASPLLSDEIQASFVQVMATMALAGKYAESYA